MTERVRLRGRVGVEAPGQRPREGHALGAHELGHRVERAGLESGAGRGDLGRRGPSGASPKCQVTRPGAAIEIGPCRYSIAG